jgi:hypothetical protein
MSVTFTWSKDLSDAISLIQAQILGIQGQIIQLQTDMAALQASIPAFPGDAVPGIPYELTGISSTTEE